MKLYNKIRLPVEDDLIGDSEIDQEIQDRDKAIVELWTQLEWITPYHNDAPADKESLEMIEKYADFVTKTRAIYGL